jgi:hypothetical protein
MMPRIVISRINYERLKDASLAGGVDWVVSGQVRHRADDTVSVQVEEKTLQRLRRISTDVDYALSLALDAFFQKRSLQ